jgi:hypothetical protein
MHVGKQQVQDEVSGGRLKGKQESVESSHMKAHESNPLCTRPPCELWICKSGVDECISNPKIPALLHAQEGVTCKTELRGRR